MIATLLGVVFTYGAFAAIVVFQPELRHALARLGRTRAFDFLAYTNAKSAGDEIAESVERLARSGTGAIIAVEGEVALDDYIETGTAMRATVSSDLLSTIFTPYSPLHDGAILISGDVIRTAGAILPLTQSSVSDRSLGTRHRAALGLSEETDAVVIVVSEETAQVSLALGGRLERDVDADRLRKVLAGALPLADAALAPAPAKP
jgi:diadenylate cyclase